MNKESFALPDISLKGTMSVEEAVNRRESRRDFSSKPLTMVQASQLLWAAYGIKRGPGQRPSHRHTSPSAGACYPLEVLAAVGEGTVGNLPAGLYNYLPAQHAVRRLTDRDIRAELAAAALGQDFIATAPLTLAIAAEFERTTSRYGGRGERYVYMDTGHLGQNVYLQAEALGLGTVAVGAFLDDQVAKVLRLPRNLKPVYLMPVGYAA